MSLWKVQQPWPVTDYCRLPLLLCTVHTKHSHFVMQCAVDRGRVGTASAACNMIQGQNRAECCGMTLAGSACIFSPLLHVDVFVWRRVQQQGPADVSQQPSQSVVPAC